MDKITWSRLFAILTIAVLTLLMTIPALADTSQPVVISDMDREEVDGITSPAQKNTFYASGRQWEFYIDGDDNFLYTSYEVGTNGPSSLDTHSILDSSNLYGPEISVWYDSNAHKVSYARHDLIHDWTVYRQGTPASSGTVTWDADEQKVDDTPGNLVTFRVAVCTDEDSYPYVAWIDDGPDDNTTGILYIRSSSTKDGTWTEDKNAEVDYADPEGLHVWFVQLTPIDSDPYPRVEVQYSVEDVSGGANDGDFAIYTCNEIDDFVEQNTVAALGTVSTGKFGSLFSFNTLGTSAMRAVWTTVGGDVMYSVRSAAENWTTRATADVEILSNMAGDGTWAPTLSSFNYFTGTEAICIASNDVIIKYTTLPGPMTTWEDPFAGTWVTIWEVTDDVNDKISRHSSSYLADTTAGVPFGFTWQFRENFDTPGENNIVYSWWFDEEQLGYYDGVSVPANVEQLALILEIIVLGMYAIWALAFLSNNLNVKNLIAIVVGAIIIIALVSTIANMISSW